LLNPDDARTTKSYALYRAKLRRTAAPTRDIPRAIAKAPDDSNVRFYGARVYAVIGDEQRALSELSTAFKFGYNRAEAEREPDLRTLVPRTPQPGH
jgi:thioredoxin-like negative regulator of GroEL